MSEMPAHERRESTERWIPSEQRQRRVVYSVIGAVVQLSERFDVPLKELVGWVEMAYFHHLRDRGKTLKEVASVFDVSLRKVSMLSAQLKENFFDAERDHGLPRRIEYLLWAEPMSKARIRQILKSDHDAVSVDEAVSRLLDEDRIQPVEGEGVEAFELSKDASRMYRDEFMVRIDGLNHLVETVARTIFFRFFGDSDNSFARTATLRVAPEDRDVLRELYENEIWETLTELDERAQERDDAIPIDVSVLWSPKEEA